MRIGELARAADIPVRTIRYYEEIGLLPGARRTESGYRIFDDHHLRRARFIRAARSLRLSLAQVREILDAASDQSPPCGCVHENVQRNIAEIDRRMDDLRSMRDALERTLARMDQSTQFDSGVNTAICPAIESVSPLAHPVVLDPPVDWRV